MAKRKNLVHSEDVKAKIQSSQLINFLQLHVLTGTDVKKTQITAAVALLKKTVPDLQSVEGSLQLNLHEAALELLR